MGYGSGGAGGGSGAASPLTLTSSTAAEIPLTLEGAAGQSGNYLNVTADGGGAGGVFNIASNGQLNISGRIIGSGSGNYIGWGDIQFGDVVGTGDSMVGYNNAKAFKVRDNAGAVNFQVDTNATAGNTRMLVYDVDNATLERVSVGAADSGGTGFKVLCIPN